MLYTAEILIHEEYEDFIEIVEELKDKFLDFKKTNRIRDRFEIFSEQEISLRIKYCKDTEENSLKLEEMIYGNSDLNEEYTLAFLSENREKLFPPKELYLLPLKYVKKVLFPDIEKNIKNHENQIYFNNPREAIESYFSSLEIMAEEQKSINMINELFLPFLKYIKERQEK